jgi:hypothetical protein
MTHPQLTRPREELAVLVKADRHYSIGGIEGFLDTIAVVHVDVNV